MQDCGAYLQLLTPTIAHLTVFMVPGAYDIPQVDIKLVEAFTNTAPTDAYRGAGRPEATHIIERMMDLLADELGMDPAEVRRRNFLTEFPYTSATGLRYDSGNYEGALDKALEMADYAGFEARRTEARARGNHRGIGLSTWVEICGLAPSAVTHAIGVGSGGWESSILRMHPTGTATVITGSSAHGQGHATSWSQIVESELGIPFDDVEVIHGDTLYSPYGIGTYGARSLAVGGIALQLSCVKVREKARQLAAHLLECAADDLELAGGGGRSRARPSARRPSRSSPAPPGRRLAAGGHGPDLDATTFFDPPNFTFPFGAHVAEVEVDGETGKVDIERYMAVDDCGNVINPMIVDGQVHGGIAQGDRAGAVRGDGVRRRRPDPDGSLVDYMIPSAAEMPHFDLARTVTPSPTNALGVKGIGEAGTIAASAAVVNAVVDALGHLGIRHLEMPLSPRGSGPRCRREVPHDPRGIRLRAGRDGRRGAGAAGRRRCRAGGRPLPDPGAEAAPSRAGDARRHRADPRAAGHQRRGRRS